MNKIQNVSKTQLFIKNNMGFQYVLFAVHMACYKLPLAIYVLAKVYKYE